ncbi:hypothetical protein P0L94_12205 [Microbacter sp. GSS18]|nr:hypothetical protein P0L94_12205 [Microbacter sp. GSS18]
MDDDARAELEALRRRAYGPDADIADDPAAGARLAELEDRARAARGSVAATGAEDPPHTDAHPRRSDLDGEPVTGDESTTDDTSASADEPAVATGRAPARHRRTLIAASAGVAGALAIAAAFFWATRPEPLSTADPLPTAPAAETYIIDRIEITGPLGNSLEVDLAESWPTIPVVGDVDWASLLGDVFGWELWIYGIEAPDGRRHCLLLERHGNIRHSCETVADAAQGALHLYLPVEEIAVALRPPQTELLDLQWRADGVVTITAIAVPVVG